uniref:Rho guanine nucleotide exchange factor 12 n=1 Tax=Ditylenchus dipsaci TaxID=166011 RepID=A0A915DQH6_9BILA
MPFLNQGSSVECDQKKDTDDLSPQSRSLGHLPSEHRHSPLFAAHNAQLVERCVLVSKQHDGYGLTVSGDHPVFVNTVKPDGAAFRAGVRQGDRILKVNGMPVSSSNHQEVVRMISGGHNVALTVLGRPPLPTSFAMPLSLSHFTKKTTEDLNNQPQYIVHRRDRSDSKSAVSLNQIIEPIFEEQDDDENYQQKHIFMKELIQMLRREKNNLECLQENPNLQGSSKLERACQKISHLQLQLKNIDPSFGFQEENLGNAFPPNINNNNSSVDQQLPSSVKSWVDSGGMHYVQAIADVVPMGESDDEEEDLGVIEDSGPFSNLLDLKSKPAHLAVFISYLLNNSNPSSLLFYLISDSYQSTSSTKELRRFAYEIFSTFLIPSAPLQIDISQPLIQQIDKVLRAAAANNSSQDIDHLKKLFLPARTRAVGEINELLADFRQKRQLGVGVDPNLLETIARADHNTELKIAEQLLFHILEGLLHSAGISNNTADCFENCEPRTLALIMSIATIIKVVLNLKFNNSSWEKLIEKCPTFMTTQKSVSMLSKMKPKRTIQIKDHQFSLNPVNLTVHCYQCRDAIWGSTLRRIFAAIAMFWCISSVLLNYSGKTSKITTSSTSLHQVGLPSSSTLPHYSNLQHNQQQPIHYRSNNRISDSCSVGGSEQHHVIAGHGHHPRPSHSSASLTPPMHRAHAVLGAGGIGTQMKTGSRGSRLDDDDASDALIDHHMQDPPAGATKATNQHNSNTMCSSPASSTSMLPPPVFTHKFDRIAEPPPPPPAGPVSSPGEGPPMSPPPPVPTQSLNMASVSAVVAVEHNVKSMSSDSGIGTDVIIMSDGKAKAVSRAHSMKTEQSTATASPQIRRNGRGVCSLGAADVTTTLGAGTSLSTGGEQVRNYHSSSTLTVGRNSDASSSSAVDLSGMTNVVTMTPSFGGGSDCNLTQRSTTTNFMAQSPALIRAIELSGGFGSVAGSSSGPSSINEEEHRLLMERVERTVIVDGDSDLEVETEVPSLESLVSWEVLRHLKPKEKKRQEVINELFHTERTHVRNLKILYQVFYRPLVVQQLVPAELIKLLFGNIDDLLEVHLEMHRKMKLAREMWRREGASEGLYGDIGELLEGMFDGPSGERLKKATALFCQNQQHALDTLRARYNRAKDDPLSSFLVEAELEMQRLVKYPLLLETIAKYTKEPSDELNKLLNSVHCAKKILSAVNSAKRNAENLRRLDDIQKRLDFSPDKSGSGINSGASFFQKFDFRQHRLIYEGPLTWRQSRGKQ